MMVSMARKMEGSKMDAYLNRAEIFLAELDKN